MLVEYKPYPNIKHYKMLCGKVPVGFQCKHNLSAHKKLISVYASYALSVRGHSNTSRIFMGILKMFMICIYITLFIHHSILIYNNFSKVSFTCSHIVDPLNPLHESVLYSLRLL